MQKTRPNNDVTNMGLAMNSDTREILQEEETLGGNIWERAHHGEGASLGFENCSGLFSLNKEVAIILGHY